ncbi:MAG TPA: methyltransferase domain-containing protein [Clostridia bacterium]|nr:methyltransferase domain-containing protein [Clostridia bacterium]HOS18284.1 methyltransferase domain-containing protein [Clostridia bacterium]
MTDRQLLDMWRFEEEFPFAGWDFSHLDGRWEEEELPWDYEGIARGLLRPEHELLDMETGGGEFLLALRHPYEKTAVTESYPPNVELCENGLAPLGVAVAACEPEREPLPFPDARFDLVLNRHGSYCAKEVFRVLKPGGVFLTQQVGGRNNTLLSGRLLPDFAPAYPGHDLARESAKFERLGFEILEKKEYFPKLRFFDVGALVYFARVVEWEFPGFSVDACRAELFALQREIEERGAVESLGHRFLILARKPR